MTSKLTLAEARLWCGQYGAELMVDVMGRISLRHPGEATFTAHSIETITETMASVVGESQMDMAAVMASSEDPQRAMDLWGRLGQLRELTDLIEAELRAITGTDAGRATNDNTDHAPVARHG